MNLDQMARRCPGAKVIGAVRLDGYRLTFAGGERSGVATIRPAAGSHVDGVLWDISEWAESKLDRYEGFPDFYGKEMLTVTDKAGNAHEVMAYTMNAPYRNILCVPDVSYLYGIVAGCRQNGIDPKHVYDAFEQICQKAEMQERPRQPYRRGLYR